METIIGLGSAGVNIAKRFSTDDSGKFVNGILDKLAAQLDRPARTATEAG